jgi:hypothetical protein
LIGEKLVGETCTALGFADPVAPTLPFVHYDAKADRCRITLPASDALTPKATRASA